MSISSVIVICIWTFIQRCLSASRYLAANGLKNIRLSWALHGEECLLLGNRKQVERFGNSQIGLAVKLTVELGLQLTEVLGLREGLGDGPREIHKKKVSMEDGLKDAVGVMLWLGETVGLRLHVMVESRLGEGQEVGLGVVHELQARMTDGLAVAVGVVLWLGDTVGDELTSRLPRGHHDSAITTPSLQ